jgi:hypothetical protein
METHKLLVFTDDANSFGEKINTTNKIQKNPLYNNKEVFLEATVEKTKYMLVLCQQNTDIFIIQKYLKIIRKCGKVQIFGNSTANENCINKIASRTLSSKNVWNYSVQNLLSLYLKRKYSVT